MVSLPAALEPTSIAESVPEVDFIILEDLLAARISALPSSAHAYSSWSSSISPTICLYSESVTQIR